MKCFCKDCDEKAARFFVLSWLVQEGGKAYPHSMLTKYCHGHAWRAVSSMNSVREISAEEATVWEIQDG